MKKYLALFINNRMREGDKCIEYTEKVIAPNKEEAHRKVEHNMYLTIILTKNEIKDLQGIL